MEMCPIKYSQTYSYLDKDVFVPYKNSDGQLISTIIVEIEFQDIREQYLMHVRFINNESAKSLFRSFHDIRVYSHPQSEEYIQPTREQSELIGAITRGDIRGDYGKSIVQQLFVDCVVLNPKSGIDNYLPLLVAWYKNQYEIFHWDRLSK